MLLLFGILVIAGVYFYSRRERDKPAKEQVEGPRVVPTIGDADVDADESQSDLAPTDEPDEEPESEAPQKIVTLRLIARDGGAFRGDELILGLRGI